MNIKFKNRWLQHLLEKKGNQQRLKLLLLVFLVIAGILISNLFISLIQPGVSQEVNFPTNTIVSLVKQTESNSSDSPNNIGEKLLGQVFDCITEKFPNPEQTSLEGVQGASAECLLKVVMLAPDGTLRADANERLTAVFNVIKKSGITIPQPVSQGQANVQLQLVPDSQVFSLPVTVGGEAKRFLLDTGASSSIINNQIAEQLKLTSTPIPSDLLKYMAVGDNCSQVKANLHPLPIITVDAATVQGMNGMGLPETSIPSNMSGVLGLDFLGSFDMLLNPKTQRLQLLPPSKPVAGAIPLVGKLGNITAEVRVNDRGSFNFMLDTGASLTVISTSLAQQLAIDTTNAKETDVLGFCGTQKAKQIQLSQLSLGQNQVNQIDAVLLDSNVFKLLGIDGIVGQNFLNKYQQHWRFGQRDALGLIESGSLVLTPLGR